MNLHSVNLTPVFIVLFTTALSAGEYVPPPTGPYQSSVVISGKNLYQSESANQVYKFPSEELIQVERSAVNSYKQDRVFKQMDRVPPPVTKAPESISLAIPPADTLLPPPVPANKPARLPQFAAPDAAVYYTQNPWAPNAQPYPDRSQNAWGNQPYMPQQQYPYAYPNQNNNMNSPFYGMPTPWSGMPKQPFFSGR